MSWRLNWVVMPTMNKQEMITGADLETKSAQLCGEVSIIKGFIESLLLTHFIVWLC